MHLVFKTTSSVAGFLSAGLSGLLIFPLGQRALLKKLQIISREFYPVKCLLTALG